MIWRLMNAIDRRWLRRQGGSYLNTVRLYGGCRCRHRSHRLKLRCLRAWTYSSQCGKHNTTCWEACP